MFIVFVYFVPSWKMLPTSMPFDTVSVCLPQLGQIPPAIALEKSWYSTLP